MTSWKEKQKELRAPDALQKVGVEAVPWIQQHQKTLAGAVLAAVGVAGVVALVGYFGGRGEASASRELGDALKPLGRPIAAGAVAPVVEPGAEAPFKSEAEKDEAVVASLTAFRSKHAGKKAAANAALPLAQALSRLGRYGEALPLLDEYLASAPENDPLRAAALEGKGYAHEAKQEWAEAMRAFEQLALQDKTEFMKGMGQYHKGRLLVLQGKPQDGAKALSEVISSAPGSAAARLATERVSLLAAQGVTLPTPAPAAAADGG